MNSPEADSSPVFETDDATTESTLIDHIACVTETSDISKADAKDDDAINQLLNRAAKLTVSEEPKAMDAAYDCASAIAADVLLCSRLRRLLDRPGDTLPTGD